MPKNIKTTSKKTKSATNPSKKNNTSLNSTRKTSANKKKPINKSKSRTRSLTESALAKELKTIYTEPQVTKKPKNTTLELTPEKENLLNKVTFVLLIFFLILILICLIIIFYICNA